MAGFKIVYTQKLVEGIDVKMLRFHLLYTVYYYSIDYHYQGMMLGWLKKPQDEYLRLHSIKNLLDRVFTLYIIMPSSRTNMKLQNMNTVRLLRWNISREHKSIVELITTCLKILYRAMYDMDINAYTAEINAFWPNVIWQ